MDQVSSSTTLGTRGIDLPATQAINCSLFIKTVRIFIKVCDLVRRETHRIQQAANYSVTLALAGCFISFSWCVRT